MQQFSCNPSKIIPRGNEQFISRQIYGATERATETWKNGKSLSWHEPGVCMEGITAWERESPDFNDLMKTPHKLLMMLF